MHNRTRAGDGRFAPLMSAWERFVEKCAHDPATGCVLWTGGVTMGRGHHAPYGSFKYERRRWFAHRWAARFIHGFDIDGMQVDHCCPHRAKPHTLCVEHVQALTPAAHHDVTNRRFYVHLQVGLIDYQDVYGVEELEDAIPFYPEPAWLTKGPTWQEFETRPALRPASRNYLTSTDGFSGCPQPTVLAL